MSTIWMDVDTAVTVPVNVVPLIDDTDFKTIETAVAFNAAGMDLQWNFQTTAGVQTAVSVVPTAAGVHDWTNAGLAKGMYKIELPASGGTVDNDATGFGWFTGVADGVLPWVGPVIGFRTAIMNAAMVDGSFIDANNRVDLGSWLGQAVTLSSNNRPDVNVDEWADVLLGTTNPLPNAAADAAGGLPISDAGGLDLDNLIIDGLKDAGIVLSSSAIETVNSQTEFVIPATDDATDNDAYNGALAVVIDQTDPNQRSMLLVTDYVASTRAVTFAAGAEFTVLAGDTLVILAAGTARTVWDRVLTGATHNIGTSAGRRLRQVEAATVHASGVIATVTNGHTFTLDAGAVATADYYIGDRLDIIEGTGAGQSRLITAYTSGKVCTLDSDFTTNPDTSSLYDVVAADVHVSLSDADLAGGFVATFTNLTTITLDSAAVATTDYYKYKTIVFTHGTGKGQSSQITDYTSGRVCTLSPALTVAVDTATGWHIIAEPRTINSATTDNLETLYDGVEGFATAYAGPYGPGVYLNDAAANTNTVDGVDGTHAVPVSTIAAVKTLNDSLGYNRIYLINNSDVTLVAALEDYEIIGIGEMMANTVDLGSQDVDRTVFRNLLLTGIQGGTGRCQPEGCVLSVISSMQVTALDCVLADAGSLTLRNDCAFLGWSSAVAGSGTPTLDINSVANVDVYMRHGSGGIQIDNAVSTTVMSVETDGQVIIDSTCTSLTIVPRGNLSITDNGTTTNLDPNAAINISSIAQVRERAAGTVWYVATAANGGAAANNGLSPRSPKLSPKTVIEAASAGDTVVITAGTYGLGADTFTDGSWANATKTLTKVAAFGGTSVGDKHILADNGSGEVASGVYIVATVPDADSVTYEQDIRSGTPDPTDVVWNDGVGVIDTPNGVNVTGPNEGVAELASTAVLGTSGCILKPGSRVEVKNLRIHATLVSATTQSCFGTTDTASADQAIVVGAIGRNLHLIGNGSAVVCSNSKGTCDVTLIDCIIEDKFECLSISVVNNTITAINCFIDGAGPLTSGAIITPVSVANGVINCVNCDVRATDGGSDKTIAYETTFNGTIRAYGGSVFTAGSEGTILDAKNQAGTLLMLSGVEYDRSKTEGTITHVSKENRDFAKNTALDNFMFLMVLTSDHISPATGLSVTATRALDDGAFGAAANAVTEVSSGWYRIDLDASDLNGDTVALRFAAATADTRNISIVTRPT